MPSRLHEVLIQLFRNRPALAPELLRDALSVELPAYTEARIDSAELNEVQPTEYRADLVVLLLHGIPVHGIVVEVQLAPDERKRYVWPVYVAGLRARIKCPVSLLVVTADDACARWAAKPINIGGGTIMTPVVLGPAGVPEITDEAVAIADPELAVLSAMAHGKDADVEKVVSIANAAQRASEKLEDDRSKLYCDLVFLHASEAVRQELQNMNKYNYEYQSDFARKYVEEGRKEGMDIGVRIGRAESLADLILEQLTLRFGPLDHNAWARVKFTACPIRLRAMAQRLVTAQTLEEALGPLMLGDQYLQSTPTDGTTGSHELTSRS